MLRLHDCWTFQGFTFFEQLLNKLQATYDFSIDAYINPDSQAVRKSGSRMVKLALVTCQRTMICLGDLARYREQANGTANYGRARRLAICFVLPVTDRPRFSY